MTSQKQPITEKIRACLDANEQAFLQSLFSILNIEFFVKENFSLQAHGKSISNRFITHACVPFAGPITGEFFICLNKKELFKPIVAISGSSETEAYFEELVLSTIQEIGNTAMGYTLPHIKEVFGMVTMLSPRLVEGSIRYPKTLMFCNLFSSKDGKILIETHLSFDLMEQDIVSVFEKLEEESKLDDTGLFNKKYLQQSLDELSKHDEGNDVSVLFLDINRLKYVNDNYGHTEGDIYIQQICNIVKKSCRPTDRCFRVGGDEIIALLYDCSLDGAEKVVERIMSKLGETKVSFKKDGKDELFELSTSLGMASTSEGITVGELIQVADSRMEQDKKNWYVQNDYQRRQ